MASVASFLGLYYVLSRQEMINGLDLPRFDTRYGEGFYSPYRESSELSPDYYYNLDEIFGASRLKYDAKISEVTVPSGSQQPKVVPPPTKNGPPKNFKPLTNVQNQPETSLSDKEKEDVKWRKNKTVKALNPPERVTKK